MRVSAIAAMASNRVIGKDNRLPWHLPADLRRFRSLTMGRWLLMGRKTHESIGRPLPGRTTVVITRQQGYSPAGVRVAHSLEEALAMAGGEEEVFLAGGGEIFRQALPITDRLYLTILEEPFAGDAYFPELDPTAWTLVDREDHGPDDATPFAWSFQTFDRRR